MKTIAIIIAVSAMFISFNPNKSTKPGGGNWHCEGCVAPPVHAPGK